MSERLIFKCPCGDSYYDAEYDIEYEDWLKGEVSKLQLENIQLAQDNKMLREKLDVIEVVIDTYKNHEKKQGDMQSDITKN